MTIIKKKDSLRNSVIASCNKFKKTLSISVFNMSHINVEIKASCHNPAQVKATLEADGADFKGIDHQIDTYFKVPRGRLKLREGNIEGALIHYDRPDQEGPKQSDVTLFPTSTGSGLKEVLTKGLEILAVVDKKRAIYFIDNVKFHLDEVKELGSFVEIEAIDTTGKIGRQKLQDQCDYYINRLGIFSDDLLNNSYSDMLLNK